MAQAAGFSPFSGRGMRLDGKPMKAQQNVAAPPRGKTQVAKGAPELTVDENYVPGRLVFLRDYKQPGKQQ